MIARRLREVGVYAEIHPFDVSIDKIKSHQPKGIILSGGPSSVYDQNAPLRSVKELSEIAPLLGICYGMQLIAHELGGVVEGSPVREYGLCHVNWTERMGDVPRSQKVWMSHGDVVKAPPMGFQIAALSETGIPAALISKRIWAVQFHPEVTHTEHGTEILKAFAKDVCMIEPNWNMNQVANEIIEDLKTKVPKDEKVLCALSGGVDSTVVGTLLTKALGPDRVHCVFVNNGLLRKNEYSSVLEMYQKLGLNVHGVQAEDIFLSRLAGVDDPEKKRKIIGNAFIEVFDEAVKKLTAKENIKWLAQGTLYPDVIESVNLRGSSVTIKTHHNVGGLPEKMNLKLIEPLRELFKDEVRALGAQLGLPRHVLWRHPFPGPGLAIRVMGAVDKESLRILGDADLIYTEELHNHGLYDKIWQAFCVLLPVRTVGVQGDGRTYEKTLVLRAVTSSDGMTADWYDFPPQFLRKLSNRITNEVKGINRVTYDVTSKPPGTIEWE